MQIRMIINLSLYVFMVFFTFSNYGIAQEAEEDDIEIEAPEIDTWTQRPEEHPEVDFRKPCASCHTLNLKMDAYTTATKYMVGVGKQLEPDALWNHIVESIDAGKKKKTMVLATSVNNVPLTTTCGQMLDPEKKVLYGFYEIGTEKLDHMKKNNQVAVQWHRPYTGDWGQVLCMQIRGRTALFDGLSPEYEEGFNIYYNIRGKRQTLQGEQLKTFDQKIKNRLEKMKKGMVMSKITIDQIVLFENALMLDGYCAYQRWYRTYFPAPSDYTK